MPFGKPLQRGCCFDECGGENAISQERRCPLRSRHSAAPLREECVKSFFRHAKKYAPTVANAILTFYSWFVKHFMQSFLHARSPARSFRKNADGHAENANRRTQNMQAGSHKKTQTGAKKTQTGARKIPHARTPNKKNKKRGVKNK